MPIQAARGKPPSDGRRSQDLAVPEREAELVSPVASCGGSAGSASHSVPRSAPRASHDAGLAEVLVAAGIDVHDAGDLTERVCTSGRNIGPTLDQLGTALGAAVADPRGRALSIGELNPPAAPATPAC